MKVLVVDDNPQRYGRLTSRLEEIGVSREIVDFASCANDARSQMEGVTYDLLVLDILIPLWPDSEADRQHSADLLTEVLDGDGILRPHHIVGISADGSAALAASPDFGEHLWAVLFYSDSDDGWLTQLVNCIKYIREAVRTDQSLAYGVDVAVVCALSEPELSEVLRLPWDFQAPTPLDDVTFVNQGTFQCNGYARSVVAVAAPRMGMVSAGLVAQKIIERLRPRLIVMTGICAGVEGQAGIGDVIFVDPCWDWQSGKYVKEVSEGEPQSVSYFAIEPRQLGPGASARSHIEQVRIDKAALAAMSVAGPDPAPGITKVVIGPVASGSAVIADGDVVREIRSQNRKVCGIEMEAYGVFAAAESCSGPRPQVVVLKGVCDFANVHKDDKPQRYAAYASAGVMRLFLERYFDRIIA